MSNTLVYPVSFYIIRYTIGQAFGVPCICPMLLGQPSGTARVLWRVLVGGQPFFWPIKNYSYNLFPKLFQHVKDRWLCSEPEISLLVDFGGKSTGTSSKSKK